MNYGKLVISPCKAVKGWKGLSARQQGFSKLSTPMVALECP